MTERENTDRNASPGEVHRTLTEQPGASSRRAQRKSPSNLVCRRGDYDGLVDAEDRQFLWRDEQLDAASDAGLLVDQAELVEGLEHLVD